MKQLKFLVSAATLLSSALVTFAYDANSYIQSGLVAQWDGIDNLGTGSHVAKSVWWKDLKGGNDLVLAGSAVWGENHLVIDGPSAWGRFAAPTYKTIEIVYRNTSESTKVLFYAGISTKYAIAFKDSGKTLMADISNTWQKPILYKFDATADYHAAFTYDDSEKIAAAYSNGVAVVRDNSYLNLGNASAQGVVLGGADKTITGTGTTYHGYGRIYAIRLYNRALTADEIANNAAIDQVRFFGADDPGNLGPGETPSADAPSAATGKTLNVSEEGDDATGSRTTGAAYRNIQAAIDAAELGDTVLVQNGTYYMPVGSTCLMTITKAITVKSVNGAATTICDCSLFSDGTTTPTKDKDSLGADCSAEGAVIDGFTFRNCKRYQRYKKYAAVGMTAGTLRNVLVEKIAHINRTGSVYLGGTAVAEDCEIVGPWSGTEAADGATYGLCVDGSASATRVKVHGISYKNYNGVQKSDNHFAGILIKSPYAFLCDSLVYGNTNATTIGATDSKATTGGIEVRAGIVENCTSTRNYSAGYGGGMWVNGYDGACRVINTLVSGNTALVTGTDVYNPSVSGVFAFCSASDLAQTVEGLTDTCNSYGPNLSADFKPTAYSSTALIGKAVRTPSTIASGAMDLAGAERENPVGSPDIGCYEYYPSGTETFDVKVEIVNDIVQSGGEATCVATLVAAEEGMTFKWDFGDGTYDTENLIVKHAYATAGAYTVTFTVFDKNGAVVKSVETADAVKCVGAVCYVSETGANRAPYESWENAARSLDAAYKMGSDTILVADGTYMIASPSLYIDRAVTIKSLNGPSVTTLYAETKKNSDCRFMEISADVLVAGFTFTNSTCTTRDTYHSFKMSAGIVSNCVLKAMRNSNRSTLCELSGTAKMIDVEIDGRGVTFDGYDHACSAVTLQGNASADRLDIHSFQFKSYNTTNTGRHAPIILNGANTVVRNSLIHSNTNGTVTGDNYLTAGIELRSGSVENCTIADNLSYGYNGGLYVQGTDNCHVRNCIIWGNTAKKATNDVGCVTLTGVFTACNASDLDKVAGGLPDRCSTSDPNFDTQKPYHLSAYSKSCLDTGVDLDWMTADALDLDGTNRVYNGVVDRGCYEVNEVMTLPLSGMLAGVSTAGRVPYDAVVELTPVGDTNGLYVVWDFGDGSEPTAGGLVGRHCYATSGKYTVSVQFSNAAGETAEAVMSSQVSVAAQTAYVAKEGGNVFPYATWADAATDVQTAVDTNPAKVIVSNGVWEIGGEGLTIANDTIVESLNGLDVTELKGVNRRVLWLRHTGSVLRGFTVSDGFGNGVDGDTAAYLQQDAGLVENCVFIRPRGETHKAPYANCFGTVRNCTLAFGHMYGNMDAHVSPYPLGWKMQSGGLMENCIVTNCLMGKATDGGGKYSNLGVVIAMDGGTVRNTLFIGCDTTYPPRSTDDIRHNTVIVEGNGVVENCTFLNCTADGDGGAMAIVSKASETPIVRNCAFSGNQTVKEGGLVDICDDNSSAAPRVTYSCSVQLTTDKTTRNIGSDPMLGYRRKAAMPYPDSPCINAGVKCDWMKGATDLKGDARVRGNRPDIGCYEYNLGGLILIVK